jgi:hypothetical protein
VWDYEAWGPGVRDTGVMRLVGSVRAAWPGLSTGSAAPAGGGVKG